jgi:hypothetical protein
MGSFIENTSLWRLSTIGGIPYKFLNTSGSFGPDTGEATWSCLIPANRLLDLVEEVFPRPPAADGAGSSGGVPMWGVPSMTASKINFAAWDSGKPLDAFLHDPEGEDEGQAAIGTYQKLMKIDIIFNTEEPPDNEENTPDPEDPYPYLDITADGNGEFLSIPATEKVFKKDPDDSSSDNSSAKPVRTQSAAITKFIPVIEWNVQWKSIPYTFFKNTLIKRIRDTIGKVNLAAVPFLFDAPTETILFHGWSYSQSNTWRISDNSYREKAVSVGMKFAEKRVYIPGGDDQGNEAVGGHNHHWLPDAGWTHVLLTERRDDAYEGGDLNALVSKLPIEPEA